MREQSICVGEKIMWNINIYLRSALREEERRALRRD
jgi:hypothetical protein